MNNGFVIPIRTSNGSNPLRASDDAPTKMILAIGSRRFRIDAYVGFSELPPPKFADVIPIDKMPLRKGDA